jgi:hypothetical protein
MKPSMTMRTMLAAAALGVATAGAVAASDEPSPAPSAPAGAVIMNLLARPVESQEMAFRQSLRDEVARGAAPGAPNDGTIRIGRATLTVSVKDPCPDGEPFHDAPSLPRPRPGRTRR